MSSNTIVKQKTINTIRTLVMDAIQRANSGHPGTAMALATYTIMTVQMYAKRKIWPLEDVKLSLSTHKIHAKDCEDCESEPNARIDVIERQISFKGDLTHDQINQLTDIASKCPVHRTLTSETAIRTEVV